MRLAIENLNFPKSIPRGILSKIEGKNTKKYKKLNSSVEK
jgi:hypothetical protein